jgi:hypothetical protein
MRWAGRGTEEMLYPYKILVGKREEKKPFGEPGVYWMIILKKFLKEDDVCLSDSSNSEEESVEVLLNKVMNLRVRLKCRI